MISILASLAAGLNVMTAARPPSTRATWQGRVGQSVRDQSFDQLGPGQRSARRDERLGAPADRRFLRWVAEPRHDLFGEVRVQRLAVRAAGEDVIGQREQRERSAEMVALDVTFEKLM